MDSREKMYSRDFVAEAVVPTLLSRGNGLHQLEDSHRRFSELRDQANLELRKNAFTYHSAILKASKDMQVLEKNLLEFKNTLADEKRALANMMDINDAAGRRGERKSTYFNGSLDTVIARYKADDEKTRAEKKSTVYEVPRWFVEAATDIEDDYEMRQYKEALDRLVQAKNYFHSLVNEEEIRQAEVHYRLVLDVEDGLIDHLLQALKAAMDCPFGVDMPTCRRLIQHIQFLDKTYDACVAFLDNRTRVLQLISSSMKTETAVALFVAERSDLLFSKLAGSVRDFDEFGFNGAHCRSALIGWIRFHMNSFISQYSEEIFVGTNSPSVVAEAIDALRKKASLLDDVGVECLAMMEAALESQSIRFLDLHIKLFVQSSQRIFQDGRIQPVTLKTKEDAAQYLETIAKAGLGMTALYMDGLRLNVSEQYLQFSKVGLRLVSHVVSISSPSMARNVKAWMHDVVAPFIAALQSAVTRTTHPDVNLPALAGTLQFGLKNLLARLEEIVKEKFLQTNYLFSLEKEALTRLHASVKNKSTAPTFV